jgi:hypothetical protein
MFSENLHMGLCEDLEVYSWDYLCVERGGEVRFPALDTRIDVMGIRWTVG